MEMDSSYAKGGRSRGNSTTALRKEGEGSPLETLHGHTLKLTHVLRRLQQMEELMAGVKEDVAYLLQHPPTVPQSMVLSPTSIEQEKIFESLLSQNAQPLKISSNTWENLFVDEETSNNQDHFALSITPDTHPLEPLIPSPTEPLPSGSPKDPSPSSTSPLIPQRSGSVTSIPEKEQADKDKQITIYPAKDKQITIYPGLQSFSSEPLGELSNRSSSPVLMMREEEKIISLDIQGTNDVALERRESKLKSNNWSSSSSSSDDSLIDTTNNEEICISPMVEIEVYQAGLQYSTSSLVVPIQVVEEKREEMKHAVSKNLPQSLDQSQNEAQTTTLSLAESQILPKTEPPSLNEPQTDTKVEDQTESQPQPLKEHHDTQVEDQTESQPQPLKEPHETKVEDQTESQPQPLNEPQTDTKVEVQTEHLKLPLTQPQSLNESQTDTQVEDQTESQPLNEPKSDTKVESPTEYQKAPQTEPQSLNEPQSDPKVEVQTEPQNQPQTQPQSLNESQNDSKEEDQLESQPEASLVSQIESPGEPVFTTQNEIEIEVEIDHEIQIETQKESLCDQFPIPLVEKEIMLEATPEPLLTPQTQTPLPPPVKQTQSSSSSSSSSSEDSIPIPVPIPIIISSTIALETPNIPQPTPQTNQYETRSSPSPNPIQSETPTSPSPNPIQNEIPLSSPQPTITNTTSLIPSSPVPLQPEAPTLTEIPSPPVPTPNEIPPSPSPSDITPQKYLVSPTNFSPLTNSIPTSPIFPTAISLPSSPSTQSLTPASQKKRAFPTPSSSTVSSSSGEDSNYSTHLLPKDPDPFLLQHQPLPYAPFHNTPYVPPPSSSESSSPDTSDDESGPKDRNHLIASSKIEKYSNLLEKNQQHKISQTPQKEKNPWGDSIPPIAWARKLSASYDKNDKTSKEKEDTQTIAPSSFGVPIGGLGCGSITRDWLGDFSRWCIGAPGQIHERVVDVNQFSIFSTTPGRPPIAQVLNANKLGTPSPVRKYWNFKDFKGDKTTYYGLYPQSWTVYDREPDPDLQILCHQISPVIPNNYEDTSFPCGIFNWEIRNVSNYSKEVAIMFSFQNGYGAESDVSGGNANKMFSQSHEGHDYTGIQFKHETAFLGYVQHSNFKVFYNDPLSFAITTRVDKADKLKTEVTYTTKFESNNPQALRTIWEQFQSSGRLDNSDDTTESNQGQPIAGALCVKHNIPAHSNAIISFAVSWDFPYARSEYGKSMYLRYSRFFRKPSELLGEQYRRDSGDPTMNEIDSILWKTNSNEHLWDPRNYQIKGEHAGWIGMEALTRESRWSKDITQWVRKTMEGSDEGVYRLYKTSLFNELYILGCGSLWIDGAVDMTQEIEDFRKEEDYVGIFYCLSGFDVPIYNSYDHLFYAGVPLTLLWPKLALSIHKLTLLSLKTEGPLGWRALLGGISCRKLKHQKLKKSHRKDLNSKFVLTIYRDFKLTNDKKFIKAIWPLIRQALQHYEEKYDEDKDGMIEDSVEEIQYTGGLWIAALKAAKVLSYVRRDLANFIRFDQLYKSASDNYIQHWMKKKPLTSDPADVFELLSGNWFAINCGIGRIIPLRLTVTCLEMALNKITNPQANLKVTSIFPIALCLLQAGLEKEAFSIISYFVDMIYNTHGQIYHTPQWISQTEAQGKPNIMPLTLWNVQMFLDLKKTKNEVLASDEYDRMFEELLTQRVAESAQKMEEKEKNTKPFKKFQLSKNSPNTTQITHLGDLKRAKTVNVGTSSPKTSNSTSTSTSTSTEKLNLNTKKSTQPPMPRPNQPKK